MTEIGKDYLHRIQKSMNHKEKHGKLKPIKARNHYPYTYIVKKMRS